MVEKLHIEISKADIATGLRNKSDSCPVALALKRAGHTHITVWSHRLSFFDKAKKQMVHFAATPDMTSYILEFDKSRKAEPATLVAVRV